MADKEKTVKVPRIKIASDAKLTEAKLPTFAMKERGEKGSKRYSPAMTGFRVESTAQAIAAYGSQDAYFRALTHDLNNRRRKELAPKSPEQTRKSLEATIRKMESLPNFPGKAEAIKSLAAQVATFNKK